MHRIIMILDNQHDYGIFSKLILGYGGANAAFHVRDFLPEWLASPIESTAMFMFSLPWMEFFGGVAMVMLIIERCFKIAHMWRSWGKSKDG